MLPLTWEEQTTGLLADLLPDADLLDPTPEQDTAWAQEWDQWLLSLFPQYFRDQRTGQFIPFASFHRDFWAWVWALEKGVRPPPFIAIWSRDAGKSTNAEMACVAVGARRVRRYVLYISSSQEQADDHVQNVGSLLESGPVALRYPVLASRKIGKYGSSLGWRRNRLRTAAGLTVDALGLDTASRGVKIDEDRPGLIIFDDIDDDRDSAGAVEKKIRALTRRILPAGSLDLAVLGVQNLVHIDSIFARLADGRADFLINRIMSGPFPALRNLTYEQSEGKTRLTQGEPTWEGLNLERCQEIVSDIGFAAFMAEHQHEKQYLHGRMFADVWHESIHVIEPFPIPQGWKGGWYVDRGFDWGSSAPFATLWFAEANGETITLPGSEARSWPKGTLFVIAEDYGWNGKPNEGLRLTNVAMAQRVLAKEKAMNMSGQIKPGPADDMIYDVIDGKSIATEMAGVGVRWERATKGPGSRVTGWKMIYDRLVAGTKTPMENPGLFIFSTCPQLIRTLPGLPRDPKDPDDVDSASEDHLADTLRYRLLYQRKTAKLVSIVGN